jgi:hypothetical protein
MATWLPPSIRIITLAVISSGCFATPARAQDFSGRFVVQDSTGARMILALSEDAKGRVTGTLSGGSSRLTAKGQVKDGLLSGTLAGPKTSGFFEARLATADTLVLTLIEADAQNQPDQSRSGQVKLTRESGMSGDSDKPAHPPP